MTMPARIKNRLSVYSRTAGCALLLALLAVCAFAGASGGGKSAASVAVSRASDGALDAQSAAERLARDRAEELALLSGVLADGGADEATRQSALAQQAQLAQRMEMEAQARACLREMGYEGAEAIYGAQTLTLLLSQAQVAGGAEAARAVDAVASLTGTAPENVKLLLTR